MRSADDAAFSTRHSSYPTSRRPPLPALGLIWHNGSMSTLDEVQRMISDMSRSEKAQVLQWIAQDLGDAFPGVESRADVCGGEPCIVRTRIPVWLLEQARRLGTPEPELLRAYPSLRAEDLATAWAYVRAHRSEIEEKIRENEEAE